MKFHNIFEQKEIDYRQQIFDNLNKKKSKKEIRKEIIETQKAYHNLYVISNNDINDPDINKNKNVIKINLDP